ncbi:Lipoprotein-releasing system ATP-binding protein LolD [Candidatus Kinetoplastibacterium sorsogonicusi]|uniref:Lipoprotein-releasing system ATP-binding protein LolD n=1 Tax=Candidatus Kinetoplastidibacterium kentomonadis TaxID=1576550 RepID=A0A3Q8EU81_9PROT|nr:ABC transporter ATP-binding protein [Candidatus Kinetoplastibacterium sorsogonicusi]AWD32412.1 Lipoprotein-releasing system ATP-binding protein LolD [Candidatus Kinetoplastibacterium sorsogonicusi]
MKIKQNYLIEANNLVKFYKDGETLIRILDNINICISYGEIISIVGISGSGKSTLLQIIGLIDKPNSGSLKICNHDINYQDNSNINYLKKFKISFIYQTHHLISELNILDNVAMPLLLHRKNFLEARKAAYFELEKVGLLKKGHLYPYQLSVGEKQRVSFARALITQPICILADEPTGSLDYENSQHIIELFKYINNTKHTSIIIVTHDNKLSKIADNKFSINNGKLTKL